MEKALTDIQGKGKYLGNGGLGSSKMGSYFYMTLKKTDAIHILLHDTLRNPEQNCGFNMKT